jgi:two-component system LytT family sensor kinase
MSKVYRYMLRNEEEQLVTLETELKFLDSYMHLLKARYCDGIDLQLDIDEADKQKLVPALTMQVIMENAFTLNCFSKSRPLKIRIASTADDTLYISNSVNPKQAPEVGNTIEEMDNLVNKYHLLNMPPVVIKEDARERVILLPLICKKEGVLV